VCSKIEKPQAVARIDEIMDITDSIMVARGRPRRRDAAGKGCRASRSSSRAARRRAGKPVVVATQMLEIDDHQSGGRPAPEVLGRREPRCSRAPTP